MALVNPNIAMSYRGVEVPQQNALADYAAVQQIQSGQRQAEVAQMQMQRMRQTDAVLEQVRQVAMKNGGPGDLNEIARAYMGAPDLEMQKFGAGLLEKLRERAEFNEFGKKNYPDLFGAAPAAAAAPVNAMAPAAAAAAPVNAMAPAVAPEAAVAPVNAMAAPASTQKLSPSGKTRQQLEGLIYMAQGNPLYKGMAETAKLELADMIKPPVYHNVPNVGLVNPITKEVVVAAKGAPTNLATLQAELALLPKGDPRIPAYEAMIKKETEFAPRAVTNVNLPPQQNAFEGELGKGQAKSIIENRAVAQDAASIIETVNTGRDILKGKIITGAGADFFVNFNQALKTAGVDFGYADAAANSQAYAANMAQNVGKIIKQFGAGTGLSDADRQYAEKMAGGKITLDAKALNKILDINERAARNVITRHNKDVAGIKTNIPLTVEMPAKRAEPVAGVTAPPVAIEYLRANPSMKSAFDAKYGAGAADRALKGQ
jgi:hypothetical protein